MTIIEITALENGAHRNQTIYDVTDFHVPDGWAIVPDDMMPLENFPFGEITVEDIYGRPTVTNWTPLIAPEPEPLAEPVSETDQLRADVDYIAAMTGITL